MLEPPASFVQFSWISFLSFSFSVNHNTLFSAPSYSHDASGKSEKSSTRKIFPLRVLAHFVLPFPQKLWKIQISTSSRRCFSSVNFSAEGVWWKIWKYANLSTTIGRIEIFCFSLGESERVSINSIKGIWTWWASTEINSRKFSDSSAGIFMVVGRMRKFKEAHRWQFLGNEAEFFVNLI